MSEEASGIDCAMILSAWQAALCDGLFMLWFLEFLLG
jgi:hypothetical protein